MRKYLRKWLGIEKNTQDIAYEHKKINNLNRRYNNSVGNISANQSKIDGISKKLSKH